MLVILADAAVAGRRWATEEEAEEAAEPVRSETRRRTVEVEAPLSST